MKQLNYEKIDNIAKTLSKYTLDSAVRACYTINAWLPNRVHMETQLMFNEILATNTLWGGEINKFVYWF